MWEAFQDGEKLGTGENLAPWHPIKPGGVLILGQEQVSEWFCALGLCFVLLKKNKTKPHNTHNTRNKQAQQKRQREIKDPPNQTAAVRQFARKCLVLLYM